MPPPPIAKTKRETRKARKAERDARKASRNARKAEALRNPYASTVSVSTSGEMEQDLNGFDALIPDQAPFGVLLPPFPEGEPCLKTDQAEGEDYRKTDQPCPDDISTEEE